MLIVSVAIISGCATPQSSSDIIVQKKLTNKKLQLALREKKAADDLAKKGVKTEASSNFANDVIRRMEVAVSLCDAAAIADQNTEWTCAGYAKNYKSFIRSWESVAVSSRFRSEYPLRSISDWMYFNEGNQIDFYAKAYELNDTQVLIAYDPSESGREMFIGISPLIGNMMVHSNGLLGKDGNIDLDSKRSSLNGSYNCSDFADLAAARKFFIDNNFTAEYDPYNLDGDGNGIPCESYRTTYSNNRSSSNCPTGKSWVEAYTRSNGSRVRGHCRKRR